MRHLPSAPHSPYATDILHLPFVNVSSINPFSTCTRYGDAAAASGSHIASAAGYDSVPGDFGTVLAQQEVRRGLRSPD